MRSPDTPKPVRTAGGCRHPARGDSADPLGKLSGLAAVRRDAAPRRPRPDFRGLYRQRPDHPWRV